MFVNCKNVKVIVISFFLWKLTFHVHKLCLSPTVKDVNQRPAGMQELNQCLKIHLEIVHKLIKERIHVVVIYCKKCKIYCHMVKLLRTSGRKHALHTSDRISDPNAPKPLWLPSCWPTCRRHVAPWRGHHPVQLLVAGNWFRPVEEICSKAPCS